MLDTVCATAKPAVRERRQARDPAPALLAIATIGWCLTLGMSLRLTGGHALHHHDLLFAHPGAPPAERLVEFVAMWAVMVASMMLPTTVPMARTFVAVSQAQPKPALPRVLFYLAYGAVWTGFAFVALGFDALGRVGITHWPWLLFHQDAILGTALLLAAVVQSSPLKDACLTACRSPLVLVQRHYRPGARGGWRVGVSHGLNCVGCCWALMLVMVAAGMSNPLWGVALTGVMVAEKVAPWGKHVVFPAAAVLALVGFSILIATLGPDPALAGRY